MQLLKSDTIYFFQSSGGIAAFLYGFYDYSVKSLIPTDCLQDGGRRPERSEDVRTQSAKRSGNPKRAAFNALIIT